MNRNYNSLSIRQLLNQKKFYQLYSCLKKFIIFRLLLHFEIDHGNPIHTVWFFNGTVDACCKAITIYTIRQYYTRNSRSERERQRRNDSGDDGLGLDPLYNIFMVHCTRQPKWHSAHNAHTHCLKKLGVASTSSLLHKRTDTHTPTHRIYTRCNVGSLTGPKAGTRKTSAGAAAIA